MIEIKSQQAKVEQLRERERDRQSMESAKLNDIKQFRKCCKTCKDQHHSHNNSFSNHSAADENSRDYNKSHG